MSGTFYRELEIYIYDGGFGPQGFRLQGFRF